MDQPIPGDVPNSDLELLENAAGTEDIFAFAGVEEVIDWADHPPEDVTAIHLALGIGAFVSARRMSERAATLYPRHEAVQRYARVLAPAEDCPYGFATRSRHNGRCRLAEEVDREGRSHRFTPTGGAAYGQQRLVKTGDRLVKHARYYWLVERSDFPQHSAKEPPLR